MWRAHPKSNSAVCAISDAMAAVRDTMTAPIPVHLQDAHYKSSQKLGHGVGYKYAAMIIRIIM